MAFLVRQRLQPWLRPQRQPLIWSVLGLCLLTPAAAKAVTPAGAPPPAGTLPPAGQSAAACAAPHSLHLPYLGVVDPLLAALLLTAVIYAWISWSVYVFYNKSTLAWYQILRKYLDSALKWLNPAVVSAGEYGQPSLSSLQLLWYTLIVVFLAAKTLFAGCGLPILPQSVLTLLAVPAAGKLAATFVSATRTRLSLANWNYLIKEKVLKEGSSINPSETAHWKDLLLTDGTFDPARFQLFCSSLLIGLAMLLGDDLARFGLTLGSDQGQLSGWGWLLAGSNAIYIGGKSVAPSAIQELEAKVTAMREAGESTFDHVPANNGTTEEQRREKWLFVARSLKSLYGEDALGSSAEDYLEKGFGN